MDQKYQSQLIAKLFPFLSSLEKIFLVALVIGIALKYTKVEAADQILMISMTSLAVISFLSAYKPPVEKPGNDFLSMLTVIVGKVLPIAIAVCWIGLLFFLLRLTGYQQMLLIGSTSIVVAIFLSLFMMARTPDLRSTLQPHLIRAVPLGAASLFVLFYYGLK